MSTSDDLWTRCTTVLREQVSDAAWHTWLSGLSARDLGEDVLVLEVGSALVRDRVEARFSGLITDVVSDVAGRPVAIQFEVTAEPPVAATDGNLSTVARDLAPSIGGPPMPVGRTESGRTENERAVGDDRLDDRYVFETFVIGPSNRFAHAAALSVAEAPGRSYNPLFIYGGAGLGKTHLLHAIGNYARENYPGSRIRYVSTEAFLNDFITAIMRSSTPGSTSREAFRRHYRECDLLLIDDVQFMEGKEGFREEFFHTFNHLHGAAKQIVLTSDRPPQSIATLEDRLRSRLLSGLITDVQPPEIETRLAILRKKAERDHIPVPPEVLEFIATHVKDNIRELEGALIRVSAYGSLNHQPITRELVEHVLSDLVAANQPRRITPRAILEATASTFGFTVEELCGPSRRRPLVTARQISMYVFRELTDFSYPAIAREFGGRDHTTVMHAVDKISSLMKERRQIYDQVTELIVRIKAAV